MNIGKSLEKRWNINGQNKGEQISKNRKTLCEHEMRFMWERDIQKTKPNSKEQDEVLQSQLQKQNLYKSSEQEIQSDKIIWGEKPCLERWGNIQKTERELQRCKVCEMSKRVSINGEERWICNGTQNCNGEALREMFDKNGSCPSYRPQPKQQQDRELDAIQEQCRTQESREVIEYWNKFGTALKPSFEPIIVARKPFKGSLVDNVIQYGVGGINIDECRVEAEERTIPIHSQDKKEDNTMFNLHSTIQHERIATTQGRFPANTILTYDETDFDEVCGGFPNTNGGSRHNDFIAKGDISSYGWKEGKKVIRNEFNDSGSASRYFYCAKASKRDRDEGLDGFEDGNITDGRKAISDRPYLRKETPRKNIHPTVKPTELMQYLVRLVTPNDGTILDPFNGSGSTGKAVMYENKDRNKNYKYIGIELSEEYLEISKARIEYVINLKEENKIDKSQITIDELMEV